MWLPGNDFSTKLCFMFDVHLDDTHMFVCHVCKHKYWNHHCILYRPFYPICVFFTPRRADVPFTHLSISAIKINPCCWPLYYGTSIFNIKQWYAYRNFKVWAQNYMFITRITYILNLYSMWQLEYGKILIRFTSIYNRN